MLLMVLLAAFAAFLVNSTIFMFVFNGVAGYFAFKAITFKMAMLIWFGVSLLKGGFKFEYEK